MRRLPGIMVILLMVCLVGSEPHSSGKKKDAIKKLTNHEITEQTDSNSEITEQTDSSYSEITESNSELNPRNSELTETNSKSTENSSKSTENSSESTDNKSTEGRSDYFKTNINDDHRRSKNRKKMPRKNKRRLKRRKSSRSKRLKGQPKCSGSKAECLQQRLKKKRNQIMDKDQKCRKNKKSKECGNKKKKKNKKNKKRIGCRNKKNNKIKKHKKSKGCRKKKSKKNKKASRRDHTQGGKYRKNKTFEKWQKQIDSSWKKAKKDSSCACGIPNGNTKNNRIVNGVESAVNSLPWMISMQDKDEAWYCGGSIISADWILTAAHCVYYGGVTDNPKIVYINIGDHDVTDSSDTNNEIIQASKIVVHSGYDESTTSNDIALIKLKTSINFSKFKGTVRPVCLPEGPMKYYGEQVKVAGWGLLEDGGKAATKLREVDLTLIWMDQCRNDFKYSADMITHKMICTFAEGKDACQGDSGGPLIHFNEERNAYEQIGVVSWGIGCASPKYPGVFVKLSHFLHWILKQTVRTTTFCDGTA